MAAVAKQVHSTAQQIGARIGWSPIDAAKRRSGFLLRAGDSHFLECSLRPLGTITITRHHEDGDHVARRKDPFLCSEGTSMAESSEGKQAPNSGWPADDLPSQPVIGSGIPAGLHA